MTYGRSDSPEFELDAETDAAAADSDASAEMVTIEVTKTPPTRVLRSSSKKSDTVDKDADENNNEAEEGNSKKGKGNKRKNTVSPKPQEKCRRSRKNKANLFYLHCRFSEVYAEIMSMNNAEPCTSLTNAGKAPQKERTNSTNHTFLSKRAV